MNLRYRSAVLLQAIGYTGVGAYYIVALVASLNGSDWWSNDGGNIKLLSWFGALFLALLSGASLGYAERKVVYPAHLGPSFLSLMVWSLSILVGFAGVAAGSEVIVLTAISFLFIATAGILVWLSTRKR